MALKTSGSTPRKSSKKPARRANPKAPAAPQPDSPAIRLRKARARVLAGALEAALTTYRAAIDREVGKALKVVGDVVAWCDGAPMEAVPIVLAWPVLARHAYDTESATPEQREAAHQIGQLYETTLEFADVGIDRLLNVATGVRQIDTLDRVLDHVGKATLESLTQHCDQGGSYRNTLALEVVNAYEHALGFRSEEDARELAHAAKVQR
jgi:hypothetical protein